MPTPEELRQYALAHPELGIDPRKYGSNVYQTEAADPSKRFLGSFVMRRDPQQLDEAGKYAEADKIRAEMGNYVAPHAKLGTDGVNLAAQKPIMSFAGGDRQLTTREQATVAPSYMEKQAFEQKRTLAADEAARQAAEDQRKIDMAGKLADVETEAAVKRAKAGYEVKGMDPEYKRAEDERNAARQRNEALLANLTSGNTQGMNLSSYGVAKAREAAQRDPTNVAAAIDYGRQQEQAIFDQIASLESSGLNQKIKRARDIRQKYGISEDMLPSSNLEASRGPLAEAYADPYLKAKIDALKEQMKGYGSGVKAAKESEEDWIPFNSKDAPDPAQTNAMFQDTVREIARATGYTPAEIAQEINRSIGQAQATYSWSPQDLDALIAGIR